MLNAAVHGFILALGLILPLGVQNVFIFNQGAIHTRFRRALPAVLTASLCDTLLITLAIWGVSVLVLSFLWVKTALLVAGIVFLLYMGFITWNSKPAANDEAPQSKFTPKKQIMFAASVSLLNPHAILDTIGVIGTSSLAYSGPEKWAFAIACIVLSWIWFTGLALVGRVTGHFDKSGKIILALNKLSAIFMWFAAIYIAMMLFGLK